MHDTTTGSETPRRPRRTFRHTRPLRGSITVSAGLAVVFILYTWLVVNWDPFIRLDYFMDRNWHVQSFWPVLSKVDRIGQRAVCLPILSLVVLVTAWRHRSWRPALLAGIGVFTVNLLVLIAKVAMSRGRPLSGRAFFSGGDMYPSGHTANILVVYGLCFYLVTHYGTVSQRTRRLLLGLVCTLSAIMFCTSLLLRWHWFSDLVGGFMVGGAVLALTVGIDAAVPFRSPKLVVLPASSAPVPPDAVADSGQGAASDQASAARTPDAGSLAPQLQGVPGAVSLGRTRADSRAPAADRRSRR